MCTFCVWTSVSIMVLKFLTKQQLPVIAVPLPAALKHACARRGHCCPVPTHQFVCLFMWNVYPPSASTPTLSFIGRTAEGCHYPPPSMHALCHPLRWAAKKRGGTTRSTQLCFATQWWGGGNCMHDCLPQNVVKKWDVTHTHTRLFMSCHCVWLCFGIHHKYHRCLVRVSVGINLTWVWECAPISGWIVDIFQEQPCSGNWWQ